MTFEQLQNEIKSLSTIKNIDFFIVGYSTLGVPIYGVHIGDYIGNQVLIEGAIHAREWITSMLMVEQVKYLADKKIDGGIYFIFMSNPDGVQLVLDNTTSSDCEILQQTLLLINNDNPDFSQWKANANAVDLNVNFDALWGGGSQNVFCPASGNFVGYYPNSEREVNNLINFSLKNKPNLTISYHTKGQVIYYGFETLNEQQLARDLLIAEQFADYTGYEVIKTENSTGGYSDWVSQTLQVPAYTIEVGSIDIDHPIGLENLPIIFEQNKDIPIIALEQINKITKQNKNQKSKSLFVNKNIFKNSIFKMK